MTLEVFTECLSRICFANTPFFAGADSLAKSCPYKPRNLSHVGHSSNLSDNSGVYSPGCHISLLRLGTSDEITLHYCCCSAVRPPEVGASSPLGPPSSACFVDGALSAPLFFVFRPGDETVTFSSEIRLCGWSFCAVGVGVV